MVIKGRGGIEVEVIADSVWRYCDENHDDYYISHPITTLRLRYHRFIHAELMTHRMFSRNASSSRAIPVARMLEQVEKEPATPIYWGKNQAGMQAREEVDNIEFLTSMWELNALESRRQADLLSQHNLHKQIVNRVLEPYQFINVLVTSTEWDNFFELRDHEDAQPEIQELAKTMRKAFAFSTPNILEENQWHTPFVSGGICTDHEHRMASSARCAKVSYNNFDGTGPVLTKDIELAERLLASKHMSPFEHVAKPLTTPQWAHSKDWQRGVTHQDRWGRNWSGNFKHWIQYRQYLTQVSITGEE